MTYTEKLNRAVASSQSCLCVGLDPNPDLIPAPVKEQIPDPAGQVIHFLKRVIDSTHDHCAAYKPNLGFFEALGAEGLHVFKEILSYIPEDKIIIADAKRGDISSTAEHYAKAYFETFNADAITLNPLMGFETLDPFLDYPEKGIYTLALTSNPGAKDFLMQPFSGYKTMAAFIAGNLSKIQQQHSTHLGMVIGATKTAHISEIVKHHGNASLLIPGIGSQGGSITALSGALKKHKGTPLINSSRGILYAGENSPDWEQKVSAKAEMFKQALKPVTENYE